MAVNCELIMSTQIQVGGGPKVMGATVMLILEAFWGYPCSFFTQLGVNKNMYSGERNFVLGFATFSLYFCRCSLKAYPFCSLKHIVCRLLSVLERQLNTAEYIVWFGLQGSAVEVNANLAL